MPKRKHKKYSRPKKLYDINIMKEEPGLVKKYGLKNRREVWRADFAIGRIRDLAKKLITAEEKIKEEFVNRQRAKGFDVSKIADILGLNKEDYLKRRLQSIIVKKGFAKTHKQARQLIIHKHVSIDNNFIDSPSHLITVEEENAIGMNLAVPVKETISAEEKDLLKKLKHEKHEEKK